MIYGRVLEGTAYSDLPPLGQSNYNTITCPVLILAYKDDPAHPVSTAEGLYKELQATKQCTSVELHVMESERDANEKWPNIIRIFLFAIRGVPISDIDTSWVPEPVNVPIAPVTTSATTTASATDNTVNTMFCIPITNKGGKKRKLTDEEIFAIPNRSMHGKSCPCCE